MLSGNNPTAAGSQHIEHSLAQAVLNDTRINQLTPVSYEQSAGRFAQNDEAFFTELCSGAIGVQSHGTNTKPNVGGRGSQSQSEMNRRRPRKSIRRLLESGSTIHTLKPIFMMSLLFLLPRICPPACILMWSSLIGHSQLTIQDSIGSLLRADRAVVVGDSKQILSTRSSFIVSWLTVTMWLRTWSPFSSSLKGALPSGHAAPSLSQPSSGSHRGLKPVYVCRAASGLSSPNTHPLARGAPLS